MRLSTINSPGLMNGKLLAIKIRRRSVALAVFSGQSLEYVATLQLSNEPGAVIDSVARLVAQALEHFNPALAALGIGRIRESSRVSTVMKFTEEMLTSRGIPVWKVKDQILLESYATPKLKSCGQMRSIVASFWPHLSPRQMSAFEAVALGFYIQIERLLAHH